MVAFSLTTLFDFCISFLVLKYITSAADFTTILWPETREVAEFQTRVGAFDFGGFRTLDRTVLVNQLSVI